VGVTERRSGSETVKEGEIGSWGKLGAGEGGRLEEETKSLG